MLRYLVLGFIMFSLFGCASKPTIPNRPTVGYFNPSLLKTDHVYALQYNGQAFVAPVVGFNALELSPATTSTVTSTVTTSDYKSVK